MGKLIGGLLTKKKKKKLQGQINQEYRNSAAAQVESQRIDQLRANFGSKQEKIQQLREGRIRRAAVLAGAANSGASRSTSAVQGYGSAETSAFANLGNLNTIESYSEQISKKNEEYMRSQGNLAVLGAKVQTQNEKAQFIGDIFDTGLAVATMAIPGAGGASIESKAFGAFNLTGTQ
jgi:hypothetical protein